MVRVCLPGGFTKALHAGDLDDALRRLECLAQERPYLRADACRALARVAHMRLLARRLELPQLQTFMWHFWLCADGRAAVQVVETSPDGGALAPWDAYGVLHLTERAPRTSAIRTLLAPQPQVTVACGATVQVRQAHATAWGCSAPKRRCPDCAKHAHDFSEAWVGEPAASMIPPALALPVREAVIGAVAARLPETFGMKRKRAWAVLAEVAETELWAQLAAQAARSFIGRDGQVLPAHARLPFSDRQLADTLGAHVNLHAALTALSGEAWQQVFASGPDVSAQARTLLDLLAPAFAVSELPAAVAA